MARQASMTELTALLIAPDRQMAGQFTATVPAVRAFQIVADLRSYPPMETLDIRIRQFKPDVVLLDLSSNLDTACELIRFVASLRPPVYVVGLHTANHSEAVLRSLRVGASEFLYAPFDPAVQRDAVARIRRLRQPETPGAPELGKVAVFTSAKPGSGASTLATQTAFAIRKLSGRRVLLADFDLLGGTIGFYLKLNHNYSLVDALAQTDRMDPALWNSLTVSHGGVDILPSPEIPHGDNVEPNRLHDVLEYARAYYDWVVLDLPAVFHRISLLAISESDRAFLISTMELASLHLTRRAVNLLSQLGIDKARYHVVLNRTGRQNGVKEADIEKMMNCQIHASFPNDCVSLHRVVTLGQPLGSDCELGRSVEGLAGKLTGAAKSEKLKSRGLMEARPMFSQI